MSEIANDIAKNVAEIEKNIAEAKSNSDFAAPDVTLLAITKTFPTYVIKEGMSVGLKDLGENRVQELMEKYEEIPDANWHLVGSLQTNKVKYIYDKVKMIHSLDRISLAKEIEKRAGNDNHTVNMLMQINVSGEETKSGMDSNEAFDFAEAMTDFPHVKVRGLMTIAPFVDNPEEIRPVFKELRLLKEKIAAANIPGIKMEYLSMGMSGDYKIAIEEGANIVRIGRAIFGNRDYT